MSAVVAIVGRPNVGKSTLFNRLIGKRQAIESDVPGTTRDRLYQNMDLDGYSVLLVDTGGIELGRKGSIEANVQDQSQVAIEGADVILFVIDARAELTSEDFHAATLLRKSKKPVLLVANKCDNKRFELNAFNLFELGFGEPIAISALHSDGVSELESRTVKQLEELGVSKEENPILDEKRVHISFLGRPNVGKSTMVNAILGKKAVIESDVPGTTRDSSYIPFSYEETDFLLIDTAGIRRRGKVERGIEKFSVLRSVQSVEQSDVCVLMLNFEEGVTNQDCHVSEHILNEGKGLIIVVNKMDLAKGADRQAAENHFMHVLRNKMAYVPWAPVVFTSGLERKNIFAILELSRKIAEERARFITQDELNVWLDMTLAKHPPKGRRGKRKFNVLSARQTNTKPPTFVFDCEWPEYMHFSYKRFLENELREQFGFVGSSIRFIFKKKHDALGRRSSARG